MGPNQIVFVADLYEQQLNHYGHRPKNLTEDKLAPVEATAHALWMCERIKGMAHQDIEKACRWLGFIQGILWTRGIYTIDEMRGHNRG